MISCNNSKQGIGIKMENLDTSAKPGDDFFQFADGGWNAAHPLTDEYARFGSFDQLAEDNREQLKGLIDEIVAADNEPGTNAQKIADLYKLVLDTARRETEGLAPMKPWIEKIEAVKDRKEIFPLMTELDVNGLVGNYFGLGIGADMMDSKSNLVSIGQGGLSLGEKEYYLDTDEATTAIREAFKKHVVRMFTLCGFDEKTAQKKMEDVMLIETRIAEKSYSNVQMRDPAANYHKMPFDQLKKDFKGIDWQAYFDALGLYDCDFVDVGQPEPIHEVEAILAQVPVEAHKAYMEWQLIDHAASMLTKELDDANFDFYGRILSGRQEQQPWWKRATSTVSGALGEAIGQLYVEKYFPAEAKERMVTLVKNLQIALGQRIDDQDWMSDETKARAHEKLDAFYVKIGYPDKWKDYSKLTIDPSKSLFDNQIAMTHFFWQDNVERKYKKPVDNTEWFMTPQTVNAYYNPTSNEICFPAAILQPPFFNPNADDATNYGAIGVVIGHEMTHGFDDQGRLFDKDGNMTNWWTAEDDAKFREKANKLAAQFDEVEVLPGVHANGQLTMGENIADHGGLSIAFTALQNAWNGVHPKPIDGFTAEQRFYLGYARVWAQNITDEEIARRTKEDVHSLGNNRVNVSIRNFQSFFDAFGIKEGDPMYRPESERVHIW